jgi:CDP-6-deoxy-D-xylo-4-hexulose-3-dehydrase
MTSYKVAVSKPLYDQQDKEELLRTIDTNYLSMHSKTREFENRFSEEIGVEYSVAVNSGSSANLISLCVLLSDDLRNRLNVGDEVITPALTWATTCFPIVQLGMVPVFVDVDPDSFCLTPDELEKAISKQTKAIMLVHLLGHPADMDPIVEIARKHDLILVEDCCEALGSEYGGQSVGTYGDLSTFSFFETHHISTGEGGMVCTDNPTFASIADSLRAFGRVSRDATCRLQGAKYAGVEDYDRRYVFDRMGYSLKMTELQASLGLTQLRRLRSFLEIRHDNAAFYSKELEDYSELIQLPTAKKKATHSWFMYPIVVRHESGFTRNQIVEHLERSGIETRPVMAGDITTQPCMRTARLRRIGELPVARSVMRNAFLIGCHPAIGEQERRYVVDVLSSFLKEYV